ncbi:MAG: PhzF family phenazine biosynthesis protein [Gammaproteobacteria bacterium]|nr:PhzF family phenazine biosynthesis protein [Gammaproteobacteria bacterium]MCW8986490.1 PhzF family phenazine biosynthesis protein [Gammaproteobacteria bacterium]
MKLPIYQVDAFASKAFTGNPAAICPLQDWLTDEVMQSIAEENNLSETAFFVATEKGFHIRWFTPTTEVELCGHATLAAAFVIFNELNYQGNSISFESKSGLLTVVQKESLLVMDFPAQPATACDLPAAIKLAFDIEPSECLQSQDYILVFDHEAEVLNARPKLEHLKNIELRGVIITAKSSHYDFVSRFFAPKYGINEDPVTGSAYTQLTPYWEKKLGKKSFHAKQLSSRGGEVYCEALGERVSIAGTAIKYLQGEITI